jgi:putative restriction endonuclease
MLQKNTLEHYLLKFQKLRQGGTPYGKAPHKPVLLLSVLHQIEQGRVTDNRLYLTPEWVSDFVTLFKTLVQTGNRPEFSLPFYHLTGEQFWHLQPKNDGVLRGYVKSINVWNDIVEYAYLDAPLFALLQQPAARQALKNALLDTYFPETKALYRAAQPHTDAYIHHLELGVLNEPHTFYGAPIALQSDEEQFVRGSLFKRLIPRLYDQTCSISRMRTQSTHGYQLIDACHIKPISVSNDDTVANGFALSPTLHRAFDRGIIGVNPDYSVRISRYITEDEAIAYSLNKLKGVKLHLPIAKTHHPAIDNFIWHLDNRFEK